MAIELSSKKSARLNQILSMLEETSTLSVKEIAQRLNVSEMTIRRDLKAMQQDEIIRRSHGKASLMQNSRVETQYDNYELHSEKIRMNEEKERIGKYAASLVHEGDVFIIDTGSTTDKLAKHIPENIETTILCYNYNVLTYLVQQTISEYYFSWWVFSPQWPVF